MHTNAPNHFAPLDRKREREFVIQHDAVLSAKIKSQRFDGEATPQDAFEPASTLSLSSSSGREVEIDAMRKTVDSFLGLPHRGALQREFRSAVCQAGSIFGTAKAREQFKKMTNQSALLAAADFGDMESAAALLQYGVDVDETVEGGITPIFRALSLGHFALARFLIEKGADLDKEAVYGVSAREAAQCIEEVSVTEQPWRADEAFIRKYALESAPKPAR